MLLQLQLVSLLNEALNQTSRSRLGGKELLYFCPKCHHIKRKLEVCVDEKDKFFGAFHCWACSISGNLYDLVSFSINPRLYKTKLYDLLKGIKLKRRDNKDYTISDVILPNGFISLSQSKDKEPEYRNAMFYLKQRSVWMEDIIRYNIGYCTEYPYDHFILIPSYDVNGNLNFFIGRRYYKNDPGISYKKPDISMNIVGFESFINYNEPLILVESVFNAITIRRNAIPLFGKYPSKKLYESMIVNNVKKVYVFLDSDAERDALFVCKQLLKLGIIPYFVSMTGGKDPNEIGFDKSWKCIEDAKEVDDCFLLKRGLEL